MYYLRNVSDLASHAILIPTPEWPASDLITDTHFDELNAHRGDIIELIETYHHPFGRSEDIAVHEVRILV